MTKKGNTPPSKTSLTNKNNSSSPEQVEMEELLSSQLRNVLDKGHVRPAVNAVIATMVQKTESYSGPLPHPGHLERYEDVLPGAADRIFSMAEVSLAARVNEKETRLIDDIKDRRLGMVLGFLALALLISAAAYCAINENNVGTGIFLSAAVIGTIPRFIDGRRSNAAQKD